MENVRVKGSPGSKRFMKQKYTKKYVAGCWYFMPVSLATWEVKIRRITVQSQPWKIVQETPS
jgi:hypothetical protein